MSPIDLFQALQQPSRASIPYVDLVNPDRPLVLECFQPPRHDPDKSSIVSISWFCCPASLAQLSN